MAYSKKIFIGADHGGFELKKTLSEHLARQGFDIEDKGTYSTDSCDYPDYAITVGECVARTPESRGIAICTTGVGASICANKVKGIRASLCLNVDQAIMTRRHNDANVLVFGSKYVSADLAVHILDTWLDEPFEGGRHQRRVDKIAAYESKK